MRATNNRIVLDLSKVQFASICWMNQDGDVMHNKPLEMWYVRGQYINEHEIAAYHLNYPGETMKERALRLQIFDTWECVCHMQLTANHSVTFTGEKANQMWKMWCAKIMNKKGKKE